MTRLTGRRTLPLAFTFTYLIALCFLPSPTAALIPAALTTPLATRALARVLAGRRTRRMRAQYARYIQDLAVNMSDGFSLEHALILSGQSFVHFYGTGDPTARRIRTAMSMLHARRGVDETLETFKAAFPCPEADTLFVALRQSLVLGHSGVHLLRAGSRMTAELGGILKEVQSINHRQTTEALILMLMPPIMMLMMRASSPAYYADALSGPAGTGLLYAALVLTLLSSGLALHTLSRTETRPPRPEAPARSIRRLDWVRTSVWCARFGDLYRRILPVTYRTALMGALQTLRAGLPQTDRRRLSRSDLTYQALHFMWKLPLFALSCLATALLTAFSPLGLRALPALILPPLLHDLLILSRAAERRILIQREFPLFLNQTLVLIEAGLLPMNALRMMHDTETAGRALNDELRMVFRSVAAGETPDFALTQMAHRLASPQIQQALNGLIQVVHSGSTESLSALRLQAQSVWQLARDRARKDAEAVAGRMMIPMFLDLLAVLALSLAPALTHFQRF